ncbi:MAG: tyrosine-type recombinase/integrase [Streptosporangiaceae bacterium]
MTGTAGSAALALVSPAAGGAGETFAHVISGVVLAGDAARLAGALDREFLAEAGWDPASRVLSMPAEHPLLGRRVCRAGGCTATVHASASGLCYQCSARLQRAGWTREETCSAAEVPPLPARADGCRVPGCQRMSPGGRPGQRTGLCQAHSRRFRRVPGTAIEEFLAGPQVRPLPPLGPCRVAACSRRSESEHGYCPAHYVRWRSAAAAGLVADQPLWDLTCPAVSEPGQVSLRGLTPLVVVQVLTGIQQRVRGQGAKITDVNLRAVCDTLRRQQADSAGAADADLAASKAARSLLRAVVRHARLALADPAGEQLADTWDLAVFGHPGGLAFSGITQSWLRDAAKAWAAEELPRHRGGGASKVREKISAVARLSQSLRCRDDRGEEPGALGRPDIDAFLNRLGYLESAGTISRYHRNVICRGARLVLTGIRSLGLTRPGQAAAGLPGDFAVGLRDIPAAPVRGEPGRDLPAEVMNQLCASLDTLEPAEVRTAVQIAIDTGRRPEDILGLPLDCLHRDRDGAPVLIYDNAKADRPGRRLPVGEATAAVITAQQARVRARYPGAPAGTLKLLPAPRANPHGRKAITNSMLADRHREWVTSMGPLRTRDGTEIAPGRLIPYAYRHTYAQRHADAGVPVDVLAELLDHRNLNVTRGYYRIGEDRRRDAVDKVTAMSFDRHGTRLWRDARALLESEHARYAIGEVAVPYGRCSEPSNVQAGGSACPVRFRCAGCDHFRTDVSYLPDLTAYLDDLLRTRERLTAAIDGVDEWARADATPAQEEITRIRRLISQIKGDIAQLPGAERARIDEAVAVIRKHRAVNLGMPSVRAVPPAAAVLA